MAIRGFMVKDNITRAIDALYTNVSNSKLGSTEKQLLIVLLDRMSNYYNEECDKIMNSRKISRIYKLYSEMTTYIVTINDTIKGKYEFYQIVSLLNGKLDGREPKICFKRKRLI